MIKAGAPWGAVSGFTAAQWRKVRAEMDANGAAYGLPERRDDSVVLASFNIRKLGSVDGRTADTWRFLAETCARFDLIAVQEVTNNLEGLRHLLGLLGPEYGLVCSDATGAVRAKEGMQERLAFLFRWRRVRRMEVATDVTVDRTRIIDTLSRNSDAFHAVFDAHGDALARHDAAKAAHEAGTGPKPPPKPEFKARLPAFLAFIRTPFQVTFEVPGATPSAKPYRFVAVNAHLNFGSFIEDRWQDFEGLMDWLDGHVHDKNSYYPDCILLGDLNLDFDDPEADRPRIEALMKSYDQEAGRGVAVNFPFLDPHHGQPTCFRTNARRDETFDQIGFFFRDRRFPAHAANARMPESPAGPDYGVFDFVQLFAQATEGRPYDPSDRAFWTAPRRKAFFARFEHEVSDHMPLWVRLPLPA